MTLLDWASIIGPTALAIVIFGLIKGNIWIYLPGQLLGAAGFILLQIYLLGLS